MNKIDLLYITIFIIINIFLIIITNLLEYFIFHNQLGAWIGIVYAIISAILTVLIVNKIKTKKI